MSREALLAEINEKVGGNPLVMGAFRTVYRAEFAPPTFKGEPYENKVIPEDDNDNSSMSQPVLMAQMMDALELTGREKVLEIGTGRGFNACLLSCCAGEVDTVESCEDLALIARTNIQTLGYTNVRVHIGDGALGLSEEAPFDAIIVTAAARYIPQALVDQLTEGGRMIIPVGEHWKYSGLFLVRKVYGEIGKQTLGAVSFVPLISDAHGGWTKEAMEEADAHRKEIKEAWEKTYGLIPTAEEIMERMAEEFWSRWLNLDPNFDLIV